MMSKRKKETGQNRRYFLQQMSVSVAAAGIGAAKATGLESGQVELGKLPSMKLGRYEISRLIAGWNPIGGYSYLGPNMDQHMREYFSEDNTFKFLTRCAELGITAHQFDPTEMMVTVLRRLRDAGTQMSFICLHSADSRHGTVGQIDTATNPIAFSHHGGVTDRLFREGKEELVHDYVKQVHDRGKLVGVSAHNPDNIKRIADKGWEIDFFMTCFHYLTRLNDYPELASEKKVVGKAFYKADPEAMVRVIKQVSQPCLAFKILSAGRASFDRNGVSDAFRYAFRSIKPSDAVIVGMYPRFKDEIEENARHTLRWGGQDLLS